MTGPCARWLAVVGVLGCGCDVLDDGDTTQGDDPETSGSDTDDGPWVQTAHCYESDDGAIGVLGIPGAPTATTSFHIEDAYDKATDIMANPVVLHDFFHASWAANTEWSNDGGRCYPVRLIGDDVHGTIRIDGFDCDAFSDMRFDVEEIHCPPEF